jgi:hypothetical protein
LFSSNSGILRTQDTAHRAATNKAKKLRLRDKNAMGQVPLGQINSPW